MLKTLQIYWPTAEFCAANIVSEITETRIRAASQVSIVLETAHEEHRIELQFSPDRRSYVTSSSTR